MPVPSLIISRDNSSSDVTMPTFVDPTKEVNMGLWCLFAGASVFLGLRIWVKFTRLHGLWYDDYILVASWVVLLVNDILICWEYANGYVSQTGEWNRHMHIIINVTSCGTLIGQAWSKTAFGVTLLRISNKWQSYVLWFCIATMNIFMIIKCILQWAKVCNGTGDYQASYRLNFCIHTKFRNGVKEGGQVYNVIMDFVFALFPWMIAWKLNMRRNEKIALSATLSLGAM
ncbi:hypothetical protein F1880_002368 [Penicillium rolfsii]|nr:hypothetical protein F1880_002368 [Penicillium rolfsii]